MKYVLGVFLSLILLPVAAQAETIVDITFPVSGEATFIDDYNQARSGGRTHHATDIMAAKMTPILAPVDGTITYAPTSQPSWGFTLTLKGNDGYTYKFLHINNDTPGTDDGQGGAEHAYFPGIRQGTKVDRGEQIAWVGDSGNAETVGSHLHFEMYNQSGAVMDPYPSLIAAYAAVSFSPEAEGEQADTISNDQDLAASGEPTPCTAHALIRTPESDTVYYCGRDGGRYVFQNESTYFSWYDDFSTVTMITLEEMAAVPLKGVVTYKPGSFMVKILSSPKIYAVAKNGTLRYIPSPDIAEELYGPNWSKLVRDIPDGFFGSYQLGEDVTRN